MNSDLLERLKAKLWGLSTANHLTCSLGLLTLSSKRRFIRLQLGKCSKLLTISIVPTQLIYPKLHDEKSCKYLLRSGEEDRMLFESFFFSCGTFFVPRFRSVHHRISVNNCLHTPNRPFAPFVTINIFYSQERLRIKRPPVKNQQITTVHFTKSYAHIRDFLKAVGS